MKEKTGNYLRYGTYVLMVFLFFMMLFYPPETQEKDNQEPLENNIIYENAHDDEDLEKAEEKSQVIERKEQYYMGVFNDQIAIYVKDTSGTYILIEVLPYPVKKVYYDELIQKVPFSDENEKRLFLEYFTS
ncbi:MAG: hypothetical protein Q7J85_01135 [Bacillota bacterium]|nr:hypothetical protein [Bacillota bacterium]